MFKNQLQELAQRSSFNLPAYACKREGPDHAPRFKATVNFNGEVFESPGFFNTLRQAEHAAAEVALSTLSRRGPAQSLAARVLDETGVCKNLLQETAQRAGVALPDYSTVRSGPGHVPVFTCTVEVAGLRFAGDAAKTKKQAEKNAAMAAWTALKKHVGQGQPSPIAEIEFSDEQEQNTIARALASASGRGERLSSNVSSTALQSALQQQQRMYRANLEDRVLQRAAMAPPPAYVPHHVNPTWVPLERRTTESLRAYGQDVLQSSRYTPQQIANQGLGQGQGQMSSNGESSAVVRHTSIAIRPGMAYQPRPRVLHQEGVSEIDMRPPMAYQPRPRQVPAAGVIGSGMALSNSSVRSLPQTSVRQQPLDEHEADEEEWLRETTSRKEIVRPQMVVSEANNEMGPADMMWPSSRTYWQGLGSGMSSMGMGMGHSSMGLEGRGMGLAPPVTVRTLIQVHAAPRRSREEEDDDSNESIEGEAATRQVLSQLSL